MEDSNSEAIMQNSYQIAMKLIKRATLPPEDIAENETSRLMTLKSLLRS